MTMESERRLRIVDFSTHMSGPLASHLLMGLGADVIKVEVQGAGDQARGRAPHDRVRAAAMPRAEGKEG